ncbi:MAG: hypothetical protein AAFZ52_17125, partial [Bacteroidota bacterium]
MRTLLYLLLVMTSATATAQRPSTGKWEVSLTVSPRLQPRITLGDVFREVNPEDVPVSLANPITQVNVFDTTRSFLPLGVHGPVAQPASHDFWFAANIAVHRLFRNGLELSGSLYYARAKYQGELQGFGPEKSMELGWLYAVEDKAVTHLGSQLKLIYRPLPQGKFQPYFGGGIAGLYHRTEQRFRGQLYTGAPN